MAEASEIDWLRGHPFDGKFTFWGFVITLVFSYPPTQSEVNKVLNVKCQKSYFIKIAFHADTQKQ